jgi:hypothetical protein
VGTSSKETCTLRRSNLSPTTLEALQVLKLVYKQDRLDFTADLMANKQDYTICGPVTPRAVDELMATGSLRELDQLLINIQGKFIVISFASLLCSYLQIIVFSGISVTGFSLAGLSVRITPELVTNSRNKRSTIRCNS